MKEWLLPDGGYLIFSDMVIQIASEHRQVAPDSTEAGGILLGYRRGPHLEVLSATIPGPLDIRKRTYFERNDPGHQIKLHTAWEQDPYIYYLGEWHTHPEAQPTPSRRDYNEWKKIGKQDKSGRIVMLIVGQKNNWLGLQSRKNCYPCNLAE